MHREEETQEVEGAARAIGKRVTKWYMAVPAKVGTVGERHLATYTPRPHLGHLLITRPRAGLARLRAQPKEAGLGPLTTGQPPAGWHLLGTLAQMCSSEALPLELTSCEDQAYDDCLVLLGHRLLASEAPPGGRPSATHPLPPLGLCPRALSRAPGSGPLGDTGRRKGLSRAPL